MDGWMIIIIMITTTTTAATATFAAFGGPSLPCAWPDLDRAAPAAIVVTITTLSPTSRG